MPYSKISDLPPAVKDNLPKAAQTIFMKAFNAAFHIYVKGTPEKREETAFKVAWAAVKRRYKKDKDTGEWVKKKVKIDKG